MTAVTVMHFVCQVALTLLLLLRLTVDCQRANRATVANKRKVLGEEGKVSVMRQIGTGNRRVGICREFGLGNSTIQKISKKSTTKINSAFEGNGSRIKRF
jgi:hypothetical protein